MEPQTHEQVVNKEPQVVAPVVVQPQTPTPQVVQKKSHPVGRPEVWNDTLVQELIACFQLGV